MILRSFPSLLVIVGALAGCSRGGGGGRPTIANHTGGGITAVPQSSAIRAIDWQNRTYDSGETSYAVVGGAFEFAYDEQGDIVDAGYQPQDPDGYVEHGFFSVSPPVFGDLDGDGAEEAVIVTMEMTGGTGRFTGIDVYAMRDDKETVIGSIPGGDRGDGGISDARIEGNAVIVDRFLSAETDGACCPSKLQIERWSWKGAAFVEDEGARQIVDNREGD